MHGAELQTSCIPVLVYLQGVSFLITQGHVPILSVEVLYFKSLKHVQTYPEWAAASSETKR